MNPTVINDIEENANEEHKKKLHIASCSSECNVCMYFVGTGTEDQNDAKIFRKYSKQIYSIFRLILVVFVRIFEKFSKYHTRN